MNKKRLFIIIGIIGAILALVIGFALFNNYQAQRSQTKDKAAAIKVAEDLSTAWFNYTKQTDPNYLAKIKPYMTSGFYDATKYVNTERPQDFEGQVAMSASVVSSSIQSYSTNTAVINVKLETKELGAAKTNTDVVITLDKIGNSWQVSSLE